MSMFFLLSNFLQNLDVAFLKPVSIVCIYLILCFSIFLQSPTSLRARETMIYVQRRRQSAMPGLMLSNEQGLYCQL